MEKNKVIGSAIAVILIIVLVVLVVIGIKYKNTFPITGNPTMKGETKVTLISPNGYEAIMVDQTFLVKWQSSGVDKFDIFAKCANSLSDFNAGNFDTYFIGSGVDANKGEYGWEIVGAAFNVSGENKKFCKLTIESAASEESKVSAISKDFFQITPKVSLPAVSPSDEPLSN